MNARIRELRNALGLTQTEFGKQIGLSRPMVANLEGEGRAEIKDHVIHLICKEYNANETWLRTGEGEMFNKMDMENELMMWAGKVLSEKDDSFKKRFIKMLMSLDEEEWEFIARKAEMLVGNNE